MRTSIRKSGFIFASIMALSSGNVFAYPAEIMSDISYGFHQSTAANTSSIAGSTATTAGATTSINTILSTAFGAGNGSVYGAGNGRVNIQLETIHNDLESHSQKMVRMNDILYDNLYNLEKRSQSTDIDRQNKIRYEFLTLCRNAAAARKRQEAKKASQALAAQIQEESNAKTSTVNPKQQSAELNNKHREKYCSIEEALKGFCQNDEVSEKPNADLDFGTLYGGAKESKLTLNGDNVVDSENGQVVKTAIRDASGEVVSFKENPAYVNSVSEKYVPKLTLEADDIEASKLLIDHVMGPPDAMLEQTDADLLSRDLNADVIARLNTRKARKSIITTILAKKVADATPTTSLAEWKAKLEGASSEYAASIEANNDKISNRELMDFEISRRYDNYEWYTEQAKMTPEGKAYDEYSMKALSLKLEYEQLKALEDIKDLLAVTLAHQLSPVTPEDVKKK